uniref:Uncharacterized protein n=1 Tax=Pinguiococcus pyrenoidosus TaxID=172671 RepID=A0A6U0UXC3_9STRA
MSAQQDVASPVAPGELGQVVVRATVAFAKRNYVAMGLWALGLFITAFGSGFSVSGQQRAEYARIMNSVDSASLQDLEMAFFQADENYRYNKGWFSCNEECQHWQTKREHAQMALNSEQKKVESQVREAHRALGLFSTDTVGEARDLFWGAFAGGKRFAKRATYWDVIFMGVGMAMGRDESLPEFLLRVLIRVVMNLTVGLIFALITFLFSLASFLYTYAPDPLSALTFFGLAALAAASVVATYLLVVYVAAVGTVVGAASVASGYAGRLPGTRSAYIRNGHLRQNRGHSHYN